MNINWVVQINLGKHYADDVEKACKALGLGFQAEKVVPFSDELPDAPTDCLTSFYGATRWINNIYESGQWTPGVFFNPDSILPVWIKHYGKCALNHGAKITTIKGLSSAIKLGDYDQDKLLFVRPTSDQKEFAGDVISVNAMDEWADKIITDVLDFSSTEIAVADPVGISHEWRLFIVDGKVISGSHYRSYHKLTINEDLPKGVVEFAEEQAKVYSPSPVFVMDIGQSADELYIVEIGCFHSAGFYATNVTEIIAAVTDYITEHYIV